MVFNNDGSIHNSVHTEDSRLGKVDNGGTHKRTENSTVRDGESTTSQFFRGDLVIFTSGTQIEEGLEKNYQTPNQNIVLAYLFDVSETESFAVSDDGDEETSGGGNGNRDINVVSVDDFLTVLSNDFYN